MKLLRSSGETFQFELERSEKALFARIMQLYPLVPAAHHQLSHDQAIPQREEAQRLLDESLRSQRQETRRQVMALLDEPQRFEACPAGYQAGFTRSEIEWLLQVLNDVRVGSWLALGSPDFQQETKMRLNPDTMAQMITMEAAGFFEGNFLNAITGATQAED